MIAGLLPALARKGAKDLTAVIRPFMKFLPGCQFAPSGKRQHHVKDTSFDSPGLRLTRARHTVFT
ncbi:MAG: hypothetical protein CMJ81_03630 [Planctomycetaceae bacterium]|nr:hypothetical protein [Planctomycetaceae bacterium]MBP62988.1 hypothetical protein [Planctomycetaceae bacterium]